MAGPNIPIFVPASVRQGDDDGYDTHTEGAEGLSQTFRGRKRKEVGTEAGSKAKGHMTGLEDLG